MISIFYIYIYTHNFGVIIELCLNQVDTLGFGLDRFLMTYVLGLA